MEMRNTLQNKMDHRYDLANEDVSRQLMEDFYYEPES